MFWAVQLYLLFQLLFCAALRLSWVSCFAWWVLRGVVVASVLVCGGLIGFRAAGVWSVVAVMAYEGKSSLAVGHWSCCSCSFSGAYLYRCISWFQLAVVFILGYIIYPYGCWIIPLYDYIILYNCWVIPEQLLLLFLWLMALQLLVYSLVDGRLLMVISLYLSS